MGNPDGPAKHERRDLIMYTVLIDHPAEGVILWEVGSGKGEVRGFMVSFEPEI